MVRRSAPYSFYPNLPTLPPAEDQTFPGYTRNDTFDWREGTARRTRQNPYGRSKRPRVEPGDMQGSQQTRNQFYESLVPRSHDRPNQPITLLESLEVFDLNRVVSAHLFLRKVATLKVYLAVGQGIDTRNRNFNHILNYYPDLYTIGNHERAGQTFIARIACGVITLIRCLPLDLLELQNVTANSIRNTARNLTLRGISMFDLITNPPARANMYLSVEFRVEVSSHGMVHHPSLAVNSYSETFPNPENLEVLPDTMNPEAATEGHRLLQLNDKWQNLELYNAIYRWWQHYLVSGRYDPEELSFQSVTLGFSKYKTRLSNREVQDMFRGNVPHGVRQPVGWHLRQDKTVKKVTIDQQKYDVFCPRSCDNNCYPTALLHAQPDLKTWLGEASDGIVRPFAKPYQMHDVIRVLRQVSLADPKAPIDVFAKQQCHNPDAPEGHFVVAKDRTQAKEVSAAIMAEVARLNVVIYDTQLKELNRYDVSTAFPTVELVYFTPTECATCFHLDTTPLVGHVGILKRYMKVRCEKCRVLRTDLGKHQCTAEKVARNSPIAQRLRIQKASKVYELADLHTNRDGQVVKPFINVKRKDNRYVHSHKVVDIANECIFYDFETLAGPDGETLQVYAAGVSHENEMQLFWGEGALDDFLSYLNTKELDYKKVYKTFANRYSFNGKIAKPKTARDNTGEENNAGCRFVETQSEEKRKKEERIITHYKLIAYNGSKFDNKIILHRILTNEHWKQVFQVSGLVVNNNRLLGMSLRTRKWHQGKQKYVVKCKFELFDPCLFLSDSLKNVCADFGVSKEEAKKIFPHRLMTSYEATNQLVTLEQLNDPNNYFLSDRLSRYELKEPWKAAELEAFKRGEFYSLRDISLYYLKADVSSLKIITEQFVNVYEDALQMDISDYFTISQCSYTSWVGQEIRDLYVPRSWTEYKFISDAKYGGRVTVGQKEWVSPLLTDLKEEIRNYVYERTVWREEVTKEAYQGLSTEEKKLFNYPDAIPNLWGLQYTMQDHEYLVECDFCSLYPSVMAKYDYPTGEPLEVYDMEFHQKEFDSTGRLQLGLYLVSFQPSTTLYLAALPKSEEFGLSWDLKEGEGIYTSVDLENAYVAGYKIQLQQGLIYPDQRAIFKEYIEKVYTIKERGDGNASLGIPPNKSLRQVGKLNMNALFGKTLQEPVCSEQVWIFNEFELIAFHERFWWEGTEIVHGVLKLTGVRKETKFTKPYHVGCFVLAYSRRENWLKFSLLHPTLVQQASEVFPTLKPMIPTEEDLVHDIENGVVYMDTDSMYVRKNQTYELDLKNALYHLKDEDEADFEKQQMKGKAGGVRILWMIAVNLKTYAYVYIRSDNTLHVKFASKGIPKEHLTFMDYILAAEHYGKYDPEELEHLEQLEAKRAQRDQALRDQGLEPKKKRVAKVNVSGARREIQMGHTLKGAVTGKYKTDDFARMYAVSLAREFNKTEMCGRVTLRKEGGTLVQDPSGTFTVPKGHYFDRTNQ